VTIQAAGWPRPPRNGVQPPHSRERADGACWEMLGPHPGRRERRLPSIPGNDRERTQAVSPKPPRPARNLKDLECRANPTLFD